MRAIYCLPPGATSLSTVGAVPCRTAADILRENTDFSSPINKVRSVLRMWEKRAVMKGWLRWVRHAMEAGRVRSFEEDERRRLEEEVRARADIFA